MRPTTVLLLVGTQCILANVHNMHMDWCEYWVKMGKKDLHPECKGYVLPEERHMRKIQQAPIRSRNRNPAQISSSRCDAMEMLGCEECEARCDQNQPHCEKGTRCAKRMCICRGDLYRDHLDNCVTLCPRNESTIFSSVKQMVPLLLKDMWRSVFRAFRTSTKQLGHNNITFIPDV